MASIRKRTWGPNKGKVAWVVDYQDQDGKRALKTFATKKEAEAWSVKACTKYIGTHTRASASRQSPKSGAYGLSSTKATGSNSAPSGAGSSIFNFMLGPSSAA
jgi:hypothetical protein